MQVSQRLRFDKRSTSLMSGKDSIDSRFYVMLRNSQPLAFLASFAIVIAAFTFSNTSLPKVHENSVIAAVMFLISFSLSMCDQTSKKQVTSIQYGKYFFFGSGMLYLVFVAMDFAKSLPQISDIVLGWLTMAVGVSSIPSMIKRTEFFQKRTDPTRKDKSIGIGIAMSSFGIIVLGVIIASKAFVNYEIYTLPIAIVVMLGTIPMFIFSFSRNKVKQKTP